MQHEPLEIQFPCRLHRRMREALLSQPVAVARDAIPRVPHRREGEQAAQIVQRNQNVDVGERRVFPQPVPCLHPSGACAACGLWRVSDQDILPFRVRFHRPRQGCPTRLGNVGKDICAARRDVHGVTPACLTAMLDPQFDRSAMIPPAKAISPIPMICGAPIACPSATQAKSGPKTITEYSKTAT